jgi:hypothetical protein
MVRDAVKQTGFLLMMSTKNYGEVLRDIADERGEINRRKLGWWIRRHADRIVDGLRFVRASGNRSAEAWKVEVVESVSPVSSVFSSAGREKCQRQFGEVSDAKTSPQPQAGKIHRSYTVEEIAICSAYIKIPCADAVRGDGEEALDEVSPGDDEGDEKSRGLREGSEGGGEGSDEGVRRPGKLGDEDVRGEGDSDEGVHPAGAGNYRITDDDLNSPKKVDERFNANIAAIRVLKTLESEGRFPTESEKHILAQYSGWGALGEAFSSYSSGIWQQRYKIVEDELTQDERADAAASSVSAYYTPVPVARFM